MLGLDVTGFAAVDAVAALVTDDRPAYSEAVSTLAAHPTDGLRSLIQLAALSCRLLEHSDDRVLQVLRQTAMWAELDLLQERDGG
jgi:hypothetical protein